MSPAQIELARHALGLPTKSGQSYRNRFICGTGHRDYNEWKGMVAAGYATTTGSHPAHGGAERFELTPFGANFALRAGERLDPEDFPNTPPVPLPVYPFTQVGLCSTCGVLVSIKQPVFP